MNKQTLRIYGIECETLHGTVDPDGRDQWWIPVRKKRTWKHRILAWYQSALLRMLRLSGYDTDD